MKERGTTEQSSDSVLFTVINTKTFTPMPCPDLWSSLYSSIFVRVAFVGSKIQNMRPMTFSVLSDVYNWPNLK